MHEKGFYLIELMVYIALSLTLAMLSFKTASLFIKDMRATNSNSFQIMQLYSAAKAIERDLEQASVDLSNWLTIDSHKLQWRINDEKITWKIKNNQLIRSNAHFDNKTKRWHKEGAVIFAQQLQYSEFVVNNQNDGIDTIQCKFEMPIKKNVIRVEQTVWPMNGRMI